MDERMLFDQFHEALDVEPHPGAYERMRVAMANYPVALKRRPAFRMRWSRMGLRVAAVLAAAVVAVAIGGAILATHHGPTGIVNAGPDLNTEAYQAMMSSDYNLMSASTSNNCNTMQDLGCEAAVNTVIPTLRHWVSDLKSAHTPTSFLTIDGLLRNHLNQAIADLSAAVAFQKARNNGGFTLAMSAAFYERAWIDPAAFSVEGTYPDVAGTYHNALSLVRRAVNACESSQPGPDDLSCANLFKQEACVGAGAQKCESDVQAATTQIQAFLIALQQNPAPGALATKNARLQADLASGDQALLAITRAALAGDSTKVLEGENSYIQSIDAANVDLEAIGIA
jgi:hypothetical protein